MREERKEEKRKAAQREEEERWRQEQEAESLRRQARAHESHLRQTEEARVEALMRGEAAPSQSTAEQILKYGPSAVVGVAHDVRRRAAELAEWDEEDKVGEPLGFRRRLTCLAMEKLWNQSITWPDGGGGGLTPMQRAQAQREDYERRLAAWKANGSPLDPEQADRARHEQAAASGTFLKKENRDLLSAARKAESWVAAAIEEFRATWVPRTMAALKWGPPDFGGGVVGRLINAGGVPLLLSYTPLLVPLLDRSDGPVPWDSINFIIQSAL